MITNISTKKIIIEKHKVADTILSRAFGLMFSKKSNFNYGLVFDLKRESVFGASLHMFFVFYPINVVFLDKDKKIVDIKENFKPFSLYSTKKQCRYLIELPITIDKSYYSINDRVTWK